MVAELESQGDGGFLVGAQVEILTIIGISFIVGFFCLTPEVHLDHILHHTPK